VLPPRTSRDRRRARAAGARCVVHLAPVRLDGAGAQELRPLAREQSAILEEVEPRESVSDKDRGSLRPRRDLRPDPGLDVTLVRLQLGLVGIAW
jgi:hypothetical protein